MGGNQPSRHGFPHSAVPVPISTRAVQAQQGRRTPIAPDQVEGRRAGLIPSRLVDMFLSSMPHPGVTQLVVVENRKWDPSVFVGGATVVLTSLSVPAGSVYAFSDIFFFAQTPGRGLLGISRRLPEEAFNGLVRFDLKFSSKTPLQLEGNYYSPYAGDAANRGRQAGWPYLDRPFGVQRTSGFGIYATENMTIEVRIHIDEVPRFPVTLVGVEMHGCNLAHDTYKEKIQNQRR